MQNMLTMTLHDRQEFDDDLGGRSDEHLSLSTLLRIDHGFEAVVQN